MHLILIFFGLVGFVFSFIYLGTSSKIAAILSGLSFLTMMGLSIYFADLPVQKTLSEAEQWELIKIEKNCKIVEKREGHSSGGIGVATNGHVGVMFGDGTPSQTAYLCDDGITYWRNEK